MSKQLKIDLRQHLLENATLSGLIGTRLYPARAPKNAPLPYVIMTVVSGSQVHTHDGPSGDREARVQFNIFAAKAGSMESVSEAINDVLEPSGGLRQAIGSSDTTYIARCRLDNNYDLGTGEDTGDREKALDYLINYNH